MGVVHHQNHRLIIRVGREEAERGRADGESIERTRRAERERTRERRGLGCRNPIDAGQSRSQQLRQTRERHLGLRLYAAGAQQPHAFGTLHGVLEQRGLADPRLTDQCEHAAAPRAGLGQHAVDRESFLFTAEQHPHSVTDQGAP